MLAVPAKNLKALQTLFDSEDAEYSVLGEFTSTKRLEVSWKGERVVDLAMDFLHDGLPRRERVAVWDAPKPPVWGCRPLHPCFQERCRAV